MLIALLAAGCQHKHNSSWAVDVARRHGYIFFEEDQKGSGSFLLQTAGEVFDTIGEWVPSVASLLSPVAESLGLYPVRHVGGHRDTSIDLLRAVLDHRDDMC